MNLLHLAIRNNNLDLFNESLKSVLHDNGIDEREPHSGLTPLQLAVFLGRFDMAIQLLIRGANPNIRVNNDEGHYLLYQAVGVRECGDLFSSLLRVSAGIDETHQRLCNSVNLEVLHVLFFSALANNQDDYALRMLNETLPSLDLDLQTEIIRNLTGALYYSVQKNKINIASCLVNLGVRKIDDNLPNLGVTLVSQLPQVESKEEISNKITLSTALNTKNYIAMASKILDKKSEDDLPINSTYLPWIMMRRTDIYSYVSRLIRNERWDALKETLGAGYTLDSYMYQLVTRDRKEELFLLDKLKKFTGFEKVFFHKLRNTFLLAICDNLRVNEQVLDILLKSRWPEAQEAKVEMNAEAKLKILEEHLINLGASSIALNKFNIIKIDFSHNNLNEKNLLLGQPALVLWRITDFLSQQDIYCNFAPTARRFAVLAAQGKLASFPLPWERYSDVKKRVVKIDNAINELETFNKRSFKKYFCFNDAPPLQCNTPINALSWLTGSSTGVGNIIAGCYSCEKGCILSCWLSTNLGVPLAVLGIGGVGYTIKYRYCGSNLPGRTPDEMLEVQRIVYNNSLECLPAAIRHRITDTKELIRALKEEKNRLCLSDEKAKQAVKNPKKQEEKESEGDSYVRSEINSGPSFWNDSKDDVLKPLLSNQSLEVISSSETKHVNTSLTEIRVGFNPNNGQTIVMHNFDVNIPRV